MKNAILFSLFVTTFAMTANAATPWWERPTICQINSSNCYTSMGAGYDAEYWDTTSNCRGMKYICANALRNASSNEPQLLSRMQISNGNYIKTDFDANILNDDCFGVRKTINNGTMASVNGDYVNVFCSGTLSSPDETLPSGGEIMLNKQPTCANLASNGFIGVKNGNCFGKQYDDSKYYIDCGNTSDITPVRMIVLNGAAMTGDGFASMADANDMFDKMYSVSQTQHKKYFSAE